MRFLRNVQVQESTAHHPPTIRPKNFAQPNGDVPLCRGGFPRLPAKLCTKPTTVHQLRRSAPIVGVADLSDPSTVGFSTNQTVMHKSRRGELCSAADENILLYVQNTNFTQNKIPDTRPCISGISFDLRYSAHYARKRITHFCK